MRIRGGDGSQVTSGSVVVQVSESANDTTVCVRCLCAVVWMAGIGFGDAAKALAPALLAATPPRRALPLPIRSATNILQSLAFSDQHSRTLHSVETAIPRRRMAMGIHAWEKETLRGAAVSSCGRTTHTCMSRSNHPAPKGWL